MDEIDSELGMGVMCESLDVGACRPLCSSHELAAGKDGLYFRLLLVSVV